MKQTHSGLVGIVVVLLMVNHPASAQPNAEEEMVRAKAFEFVKQFNSGNIDAVTKLVSFPFMPGTPRNYISQGRIKDDDPRIYSLNDLQRKLQKLKEWQLPHKLGKVQPFQPSIYNSFSGKNEIAKAIQELMKNGGYEASFQASRGRVEFSISLLLIVKDNEAKIVGWIGSALRPDWQKSKGFGRNKQK